MANYIRTRLYSRPFWLFRKGTNIPSMPDEFNMALEEIPKGVMMQKTILSTEKSAMIDKVKFWQGVLAAVVAAGVTFASLRKLENTNEYRTQSFKRLSGIVNELKHDQNIIE